MCSWRIPSYLSLLLQPLFHTHRRHKKPTMPPLQELIHEEKHEEIQIGLPTDVKHVAHIGSDDPSANAPSWMTEFKSGNEPSAGTTNAVEMPEEHTKSSSKGSKIQHLIPKSRHHSIDNEPNSSKHKHTQRHRLSDPSEDSSNNESSGGSRHRRHRRGSNHGSDAPSQDIPPTSAKHSHRRKSKSGTSEDGSVRKPSSRTSRRSSKGDSLTDISLSQELASGSGPEIGHVSNRV